MRITYSDAFDPITPRGNERKAEFKNRSDRQKFRASPECFSERCIAAIHCYCRAVLRSTADLISDKPEMQPISR